MSEPDHDHIDSWARGFDSADGTMTGTAALSRFLVASEDIDLGMRALFCEVLDNSGAASPCAEAQVACCLVLGHFAPACQSADDPGTDRLMDALRTVVCPSIPLDVPGCFLPPRRQLGPAALVAALVLGLERDRGGCIRIEWMLEDLGAVAVGAIGGVLDPFSRRFRRAALSELALAGAFEPGGDRPDGLAAQFVRTWQRLSWLGMIYRARRSWGGLDFPATELEAGRFWRRMFNLPALAAWEFEPLLSFGSEDVVGPGLPLCRLLGDLAEAVPAFCPADARRRGWHAPCRIVIDGAIVRAVAVSATDLTDERPVFGMIVSTARGDFAAEVEIDADTGAAAVELGHRDAH
jgi:hypothetical protein